LALNLRAEVGGKPRNSALFSRAGPMSAIGDWPKLAGKALGGRCARRPVKTACAHPGRTRPHQPFFGLVVVSGEDATIRQSADGLYLYDEDGRQEIALPRKEGCRLAELMEMHEALSGGRKPFHDGGWASRRSKCASAFSKSARTGREVAMTRQVAI